MRKLGMLVIGVMLIAAPMVYADLEFNTTDATALAALNAADAAALDAIDGVTATTADAIIAYKATIGGAYTDFIQLDDVDGVGPTSLANICLYFGCPLLDLDIPVLTVPVTDDDGAFSASWTASKAATIYELVESTDNAFGVYNSFWPTGTSEPNIPAKSQDGYYYYRVRAWRQPDNVSSDWSAVKTVAVGDVAAPGADDTGLVSVSLTIAAVISLDVATESGDSALTFPAITEACTKASEHIEVNATSNYGSWAIDIYTNNFGGINPDTDLWGTQVGGLVDVANGRRIPLGWCVFSNEPQPDELTGNPGATRYDVVYGTVPANRWTYVKDRADSDWDSRGGYATVASGGGGSATIKNPNNCGGGYVDPHNPGDSLYVYIETVDTAYPLPGAYTGTIGFDLYHQ